MKPLCIIYFGAAQLLDHSGWMCLHLQVQCGNALSLFLLIQWKLAKSPVQCKWVERIITHLKLNLKKNINTPQRENNLFFFKSGSFSSLTLNKMSPNMKYNFPEPLLLPSEGLAVFFFVCMDVNLCTGFIVFCQMVMFIVAICIVS